MAALGPPCAHYENYPPDVWTVGDSTTTGVGAATLPAWRYGFYSAYIGKVRMVGSQSYGGVPDVLGAQASHEGHNGQTVVQLKDGSIIGGTEIYKPDVAIFIAGINDIITDGVDATTLVSRWSTALDEFWKRRTKGHMQIILCPPFRPNNSTHDAVIIAATAAAPAMIAGKSYAANVTFFTGAYDAAGLSDGMNDENHPNDLGYTRIGAALATGLATQIALARGAT